MGMVSAATTAFIRASTAVEDVFWRQHYYNNLSVFRLSKGS